MMAILPSLPNDIHVISVGYHMESCIIQFDLDSKLSTRTHLNVKQ